MTATCLIPSPSSAGVRTPPAGPGNLRQIQNTQLQLARVTGCATIPAGQNPYFDNLRLKNMHFEDYESIFQTILAMEPVFDAILVENHRNLVPKVFPCFLQSKP